MATLPFVRPWPHGTIPYVIEHSGKNKILKTIRMIEEETPLKFTPRTGEQDYILFVNGDENIVVNPEWNPPYETSDVLGFCRGESRVILKDDPWLALHELGHVIGLIHEHQRSDRDLYIALSPDECDPNWTILKESVNYGLPYDGRSMTHYGLDWQGRDAKWKKGENPGQQWSRLTETDIRSIRYLYGYQSHSTSIC